MRGLLIVVAALALSGCAGWLDNTILVDGVATAVVCPPTVQWPVDMQKQAAIELQALPPTAALRKMVPLAIEQRNINARCAASNAANK